MSFKNLLLEKREGKGIITLNRPDDLNALSLDAMSELAEALQDVAEDASVRIVILKGSGKCFCAGLDLKVADDFRGKESENGLRGLVEILRVVLRRMEDCEKPIICAVHSYAITGGFLLSYFCDLIVASEDAVFQDTHAKWGLVPGGWESLRIPRLVSLHRAKRIFFTCERITAKEAKEMGLVYRVVPRDQLDEEVEALANRMLELSSESFKYIKTQINKCTKIDWASAVELDNCIRKPLLGGFMTSEAEERLSAFVKK